MPPPSHPAYPVSVSDGTPSKYSAQILPLPEPSAPLSALYLRYRRDIIEFVRRKFGPGPPEPEDVAQAVFLQLAAQRDPALIQNPRAFLLKSAQNLVLDHHRRAGRQEGPARELESRAREKMSDFDLERVVTGEERLNVLLRLLERLPAHKQQMVLLSRIHGLSCEDIGRRLGMSAESVQKQIERVLKDCLTALERYEHG